MLSEDRALLGLFAGRVRLIVPTAKVWAFGSRARGNADPESDLDLCVIVPQLAREVREQIHSVAWEIGFDHGRLLAPVIFSQADFSDGPMSASRLVANIHRDGIVA